MAKNAEVQREDEMNRPKFDRMLLIPIGISILSIILILFVFMYYMNQTSNNFSILTSMIEQYNISMDSVISQGRNITHQYLLMENNISALSQQLNVTSQNSLQQINSLKESNANLQNQLSADESKIAAYEMKLGNLTANLQNQLTADEKKFDNLTAYVNKINQTSTTIIIYVNGTLANKTSSQPSPYLCDTTGVPSDLLFQYTFNCTCILRKTYGPYFNAGEVCNVNHDWNACACYQTICNATGMC